MGELKSIFHWKPFQLYDLLAEQVKYFQKSRHMENDSSLPQETVQELFQSILYTLSQGSGGVTLQEAFTAGQALLQEKAEKAVKLSDLVEATWEGINPWAWEAISQIRRFLQSYNWSFFAHRRPLFLSYPLLCGEADGEGIDWVLEYLQGLWMENQILASFDPEALEALADRLPPDYWAAPQNHCEQVLLNGLGCELLGRPPQGLEIDWDGIHRMNFSEQSLHIACQRLCQQLSLPAAPAAYALSGLQRLLPRVQLAVENRNWTAVFVISESDQDLRKW